MLIALVPSPVVPESLCFHHFPHKRVQSGRRQCQPGCNPQRRPIGHDHNEGAARSGCSLRASDQALESQDEGIHLWRAQRDLHHRPAEDAEAVQGRVEVCHRAVRQRQDDSVCRHQAPGAGCRGRRGQPRGDALHQPALAGRAAHQLGDGAEVGEAPSGTG